MARHPFRAQTYDLSLRPMERAGLADRRRRLLSAARGEVLEVGAGTGLNLAHYPAEIERLVAVEPDADMAKRLRSRATDVAFPVEIHVAGLQTAPLESASFDTVVATLVLCTVADPDAALARLSALLAPGGRLLFIEHVRGVGLRARAQQAATPLWRRLAHGCHPDRDTPARLRAAGFVIDDIERFRLARGGPLLAPAVQGVAWPRVSTAAVAS